MENSARIRINLSSKEFEIEGQEQFVKEYADRIEDLLVSLTISKPPTTVPPPEAGNNYSSSMSSGTEIPNTFGEYLHTFPSSITDVDRILIAGFYVQSQSAEKSFKTVSANDLLKEQGIKLSNAADGVAKNKKVKRVFALTKGFYRVSNEGQAHIKDLLEKK